MTTDALECLAEVRAGLNWEDWKHHATCELPGCRSFKARGSWSCCGCTCFVGKAKRQREVLDRAVELIKEERGWFDARRESMKPGDER
jgi:hypothetical protein